MITTNHWDVAFDNMGHVPNSSDLPAFWAKRAAQYREDAAKANHRIDTDIQYGTQAREVFDLVWPDTTPKGLMVFVHGGYWIRLDKAYWTDLAEGARANGWVVCLPSYTLAPEAHISHITKQVSHAITKASELVAGPIRLSGHSAGGHLVTRMQCGDKLLPASVMQRVEHTVSISGLHDLRPLMHTSMNESLKLDSAEANTESPALHLPVDNTHMTAWVGGGERPEFIRQSELLKIMWDGLGANISCTIDSMHNHFTVIEGLKDPRSAITQEILKTVS